MPYNITESWEWYPITFASFICQKQVIRERIPRSRERGWDSTRVWVIGGHFRVLSTTGRNQHIQQFPNFFSLSILSVVAPSQKRSCQLFPPFTSRVTSISISITSPTYYPHMSFFHLLISKDFPEHDSSCMLSLS